MDPQTAESSNIKKYFKDPNQSGFHKNNQYKRCQMTNSNNYEEISRKSFTLITLDNNLQDQQQHLQKRPLRKYTKQKPHNLFFESNPHK
jgi:hypothetical protein